MPIFIFTPAGKTVVPRLGITGPGTYDLSQSDADELNGRIEGKDGAPALVLASAAPAKPAKGKAAATAIVTPVDPSVEVT